jgi:hypothetical protein
MAGLLVKVDPEVYSKYTVKEGKKLVFYAKLWKALYGTLKAALLFWKDLSAALENWGYEHNLYDWCVMNKMLGGKQCTVLWHIDNLKISHMDVSVVNDLIDLIDNEYGKEGPITITRGRCMTALV